MRTFWISIAASLLLHALVLSGLPGVPVIAEPAATAITARLVETPPPPAPKPKPLIEPAPPAPARKPPTRVEPRPAPAPRGAPPAPTPVIVAESAPTDDQVAAATDPSRSEALATESAPTPPAEAVPPAPESPPVASAEPAPAPAAGSESPQTGSISYELFYGRDKFSIGRSVQTWSIDKATYRLTSFAETTGLLSVFKPYQYNYVSEGRIDAEGLHPEHFSVRRGREGEQQASARFDWGSHQLTFGPIASPRTVPLQPGTHDLLSFIYQLARTPLTPGRRQLVITTGTKLDTYLLDIGPEETVQLPFGSVRAIPVRQVRVPGEESMELWLAPEQRFLPVRIRFLDRDGDMSVEQIATRISLDGQ